MILNNFAVKNKGFLYLFYSLKTMNRVAPILEESSKIHLQQKEKIIINYDQPDIIKVCKICLEEEIRDVNVLEGIDEKQRH